MIYTPLNQDGGTGVEQEASQAQWEEAVYVTSRKGLINRLCVPRDLLCSSLQGSTKKRDKLLRNVIQHYRETPVTRDQRRVDLSASLMTIHSFTKAVGRSEVLTELFYAPYTSKESVHFDRKNFLFNLPAQDRDEPNFRLLRRRQVDINEESMLNGLLPAVEIRASRRLCRHLVIMATLFWIAGLEGLEKADQSYSLLSEDASSLDFASLFSNSGLLDRANNSVTYHGRAKCLSIMASGIDKLTTSEIRNLINSVKTLISPKENQAHLEEALHMLMSRVILQSHEPLLMENDVFEILADTEKSSLHRHFFTTSEIPDRREFLVLTHSS